MLFIWKNNVRPLEGNICLEAVLFLKLCAFKAVPCSALYCKRADLVFPRFCVTWFLASFSQKDVLTGDQLHSEKKRLQKVVFNNSHSNRGEVTSHCLSSPNSSVTPTPTKHACLGYIFSQVVLTPGVQDLTCLPLCL